MKKIYPLISAIMFSINVYAQTNQEQAEILFQKAENAYENKQYVTCRDRLLKVIDLLGSNNSKIMYLFIKNMDDGMNNDAFRVDFKNYDDQLFRIKTFFELINKNTYPPEKYKDIISIKLDIEEKIILIKKQ